jgi:hypothetical protein
MNFSKTTDRMGVVNMPFTPTSLKNLKKDLALKI